MGLGNTTYIYNNHYKSYTLNRRVKMKKIIAVHFTTIDEEEWIKFHGLVARQGKNITKVIWGLIQEYMEKEGREE